MQVTVVNNNAPSAVALLAEGVDRNYDLMCIYIDKTESPSSRRAWIEIL